MLYAEGAQRKLRKAVSLLRERESGKMSALGPKKRRRKPYEACDGVAGGYVLDVWFQFFQDKLICVRPHVNAVGGEFRSEITVLIRKNMVDVDKGNPKFIG